MKKKPIFVWQDRVLKKVDPDKILFLETEGNYTKLFLKDKTYYLVRSTLSTALEKLSAEDFIQTHRSHAVSGQFVTDIAKDYVVVEYEDIKKGIPLSRRFYKQIIQEVVDIIE